MNENNELLKMLYLLLIDELNDINQYMAPSELCGNRNSGKLHMAVRKKAIDKMNNAEWLIDQIIFFGGEPIGINLNAMSVCEITSEMINKVNGEMPDVLRPYNEAFKHSGETDDKNAAKILNRILRMKKGQEDWSGFALVN
jgi:bacterioferritin